MSPRRSMSEFLMNFVRKRDFYAGLLMIVLGAFFALKGPGYRTGTLMHMGPGFMPTALGVILVGLGIAIAAPAVRLPPGEEEQILPEQREWLAWGLILAGPLAFIIGGEYGGFIPGTFLCVFVSSLGDRTITWKAAVGLATVVTAFGVLIFSYILQVQMPLVRWG
jgi:Tripartite tricarboxylate transporter TctB family